LNGIIEEANKRIQPTGTGKSLDTQDTLNKFDVHNQDLEFRDSFKFQPLFWREFVARG
jgi:hypothetical protein